MRRPHITFRYDAKKWSKEKNVSQSYKSQLVVTSFGLNFTAVVGQSGEVREQISNKSKFWTGWFFQIKTGVHNQYKVPFTNSTEWQ